MTTKRISSKTKFFRPCAVAWWNKLDIVDKQKFKKVYENIYENNFREYPHLTETRNTRISKLTDNQIYCIWRFKAHL